MDWAITGVSAAGANISVLVAAGLTVMDFAAEDTQKLDRMALDAYAPQATSHARARSGTS